MLENTAVISNGVGLHARPAARLVETAMRFKSDVILLHGGATINAKSAFSVLSGNIRGGSEVVVRVEGSDEEEAMAAVVACLRNLPNE